MSDVTLDFQRPERTGFDEAIFCQGKSVEQLNEILDTARGAKTGLLLTRLSAEQLAGLAPAHRERLDYDAVSRTAFSATPRPEKPTSRVCVVSAGTSDAPVAREVARTLRWFGEPTTVISDVGVAGLWRLLERVELLKRHPVCVVVAGMDAALPTVVGGLIGSVIIGVPTSTGYGISEHGKTALRSMLASCAPGIAVMNIDNGYGGACAAFRVLRALDARP